MQKPKAKSVSVALPQTDPADDGPEVDIIRSERVANGSDPSNYLSGWWSRLAPLMIAEALSYRKGFAA